MLPTYNLFEGLHTESRVWHYIADRKLTDAEIDLAKRHLSSFNSSWSAHGKKLHSATTILFNQLIILAADESLEQASGCSIDSSVRAIKELGNILEVDFFNRMNVLSYKDDEVILLPYSLIRKNTGIRYFNPLVTSLKEVRESWLIES